MKLGNVPMRRLCGEAMGIDWEQEDDAVVPSSAARRYAGQRMETRKHLLAIFEDRECLLTCFETLDADGDELLTAAELRLWLQLLMSGDPTIPLSDLVSKPHQAQLAARDHGVAIEDIDFNELLVKLGQAGDTPQARLDWQDFLLANLEFYAGLGVRPMRRILAGLMLLEPAQQVPGAAGHRLRRIPRVPQAPVPGPEESEGLLLTPVAVAQAAWQAPSSSQVRLPTRRREPLLPLPPLPAAMLGLTEDAGLSEGNPRDLDLIPSAGPPPIAQRLGSPNIIVTHDELATFGPPRELPAIWTLPLVPPLLPQPPPETPAVAGGSGKHRSALRYEGVKVPYKLRGGPGRSGTNPQPPRPKHVSRAPCVSGGRRSPGYARVERLAGGTSRHTRH